MRATRVLIPALLLIAAITAGCTVTSQRYGAHVSNTLALREAGLGKVSIGEFRKDPAARHDVDRVKARAMTVVSAYGSYTAYLREAFTSEFDHADLLDPASPLRIDGVLLKNELAGGLDREYVIVETDLTVTRGGATLYRGKKTGRYEWDSTYPGEVAIPRAIANYQAGVQRLIAAYIADPEFVAALKERPAAD
jgi:hypothetical protein